MTKLLRVSLCITFILMVKPAYGLPEFLVEWRTLYSLDSPIDDNNSTECQICHVSALGGSAAGWNGYGWRIRQLLQTSSSDQIRRLIVQAGVTDADFDDAQASSVTEIKNGNHPGWRDGPTNIRYLETGVTESIATPNLVGIDLDPPTPLDNPIVDTIRNGSQTVSLATVASGFVSPLLAVAVPGVDDVLFVVDQVGIVWRVDLNDGSKTRFFDISSASLTFESSESDLVNLGDAGFGPFDERGLLGLAFHPNFLVNGKFYTYQSERATSPADFSTVFSSGERNHQSVVAEWLVSDPSLSSPTVVSKREVMVIDQPQFNHNGGMIAFASDGFLYISVGDGGGRDDQDVTIETINISTGLVENQVLLDGHGDGNGRNPANPLGTILRIDPDLRTSRNGQYGVPADNPFDGSGEELAEIFAYGLRNTYRFSFDSENGNLYAGDVGQGDIEEINLIESGKNYGWNYKEGSFWFYPNESQAGYVSSEPNSTAPNDLTDPILQYDHDEGISVTGGYVYRGSELDGLQGAYIFADWSSDFGVPLGRLFYSTDFVNIQELGVAGQNGVGLFITGFGQDNQGELYVLGNTTGSPTGSTGVLQKIVVAVEEESCFPIPVKNGGVAVICL